MPRSALEELAPEATKLELPLVSSHDRSMMMRSASSSSSDASLSESKSYSFTKSPQSMGLDWLPYSSLDLATVEEAERFKEVEKTSGERRGRVD